MIKFFDGAFGTYFKRLLKPERGDIDEYACERANIDFPEIVGRIHTEYISAGADYIKTNTFNAGSESFSDSELVKNIIKRGFNIAKDAAAKSEREITVFADIGYKLSASAYIEVIDIFLELGATHFLFETLAGTDNLEPALRYLKSVSPGSFVCVSFAVDSGGYTRAGYFYKTLIGRLSGNKDIDLTGLNCISGAAHLLSLVKNMAVPEEGFCVMPNSGYPSVEGGRTVFEDNTEYFAQKLAALCREGVTVLGGCCGTTPAHIAAAVRAVNRPDAPETTREKLTSVSFKSGDKLALKPVSVELEAPKDLDYGYILEAAGMLKKAGVSTVTIPDSPLAKAHADSLMTAAFIKRAKNIDVMPHITCRDKNHLAIKGALIAAGFDGINKALVVTGDPLLGDIPKRGGVFAFNSVTLTRFIKELNTETLAAAPYKVGCALNVNAINFSAELDRAKEKLAAGADCFYSQPIFSGYAAQNFIRAKNELDVPMNAGILPVASYKNALFLTNEVSGIKIPDGILSALKDAAAEDVFKISISFARESIKAVYDYADGFYFMTPLRKTGLICALIDAVFC